MTNDPCKSVNLIGTHRPADINTTEGVAYFPREVKHLKLSRDVENIN